MRWVLGMAATVGLLVPAPASAQGEAVFPDGDWQGVMVYSVALSVTSGGTATGTGNGSFTLTVADGAVSLGSFGFSASSEVAVPGGTGSATVSAEGGTVAGPAGAPLFTPGDLRISGTITLDGGISVPIDTVVPAAQTSGLVLSIDAVGCDRVSGDMSQEITEELESLGVGVPSLAFRWSAVRAGADPAVTDALTGAVDEADKLVIAAARGDLDPAALGDLLGRADGLSADLPSSGSCPTETFSTPLSGAVLDLLTALTAVPGRATAGQLWAAVNAGIRTGVLSAGSPLADAVSAALSARLAGATGSLEAYSVHLTARAIGDDDLADEALDVAGAG